MKHSPPAACPAYAVHPVGGGFLGPMKDGSYWFVNYCEDSKWVNVEKVRTTYKDNIKTEDNERVLGQLFDYLGVPIV